MITVLILLSLCAMTCFNFLTHVVAPQGAGFVVFHAEWMAGVAPSPFRFRLLAPLLIETLGNGNVLHGYALLHFIALPVWLVSLYAALRAVVGARQALFGVALVAVFLPVSFDVYGGASWAVVEWVLFTWAFICIFYMRRWSLSPR